MFRNLVLASLTMSAVCAVPLAAAAERSWDALVAAERGFATASARDGLSTSFSANLAEDSVIFRPGPVAGRAFYVGRPNPPIALDWAPEAAEISAGGDFGYDYGPWEIHSKADPAAPTAHGHFFSVWERDGQGRFSVVLDLGVEHAALPLTTTVAARGTASKVAAKPLTPRERERRAQLLLGADRALVLALAGDGGRAAWLAAVTEDVAVLRNGGGPISDRTAVENAAPSAPLAPMELAALRVAAVGDLAATAGYHVVNEKKVEHYARVWRWNGDGWKVAVDLLDL